MNAQQKLIVLKWRPLKKGASLQGFATLQLPSGLIIHDITFHRREDGATWVAMPARQYQKADGGTAWAQIIEFANKDAQKRFQKLAREAVDRYLEAGDGHEMTDEQDNVSRKRCDTARDRVLAANRSR
jgi:hypothetical protein